VLLVVSAISSVLFYWGILPAVVRILSRCLQRPLGISGRVGLGAAANVFVGMVEAPLMIREYLADMTRSELFIIMTTGMATVAGTVMVLYASILSTVIPDALGHLLTASIISAPAAILVALIMVPDERSEMKQQDSLDAQPPRAFSAMDALTRGTLDGVSMLINIVAMLIVLVVLVSLVNNAIGLLPAIAGQVLSLQLLLGYLMTPVARLMGIPWNEALDAGRLLGTKLVLNELVAYLDLMNLPQGTLRSSSVLILTYALCGFANFGSLGIMLGGFSVLVPGRRDEVAGLGMKSLVAGTIATLMTGTVVGIIT